MEQQHNVTDDAESGTSEPRDQKPTLSSLMDDVGPNMDDICSSSTSSTVTENAEVRPVVTSSAETSPLTEVVSGTDISRRVSARCRREDSGDTSDRKLNP